MAKLERDIERIKGDIADLGRYVKGEASSKLEDYREVATEKVGVAKDKAIEMGKKADEYVHEKPWQTVAVAGAVGFLVGWIVSRKRD
jgi:ElaB/YqjD/DUF883 family membrane-anchored ribosome-binding protein